MRIAVKLQSAGSYYEAEQKILIEEAGKPIEKNFTRKDVEKAEEAARLKAKEEIRAELDGAMDEKPKAKPKAKSVKKGK